MKIYSKTGDAGETSILDGTRVSKNDSRIDLYGEIDELNSMMGLATFEAELEKQINENVVIELREIQYQLFLISSLVACPIDKRSEYNLQELDKKEVLKLEDSIDKMQEQLPLLKNFILPGGSRVAGLLHVCRCITRRVERKATSLNNERPEYLTNNVLIYFNRLSDYFFVLARFCNHTVGAKENLWQTR